MSFLEDIPCAIRGFHIYRRNWNPVLGETLHCIHDKGNPFDVFAIKTCSPQNGQTLGHLPREISRATKFLIDRGAEVNVQVSGNHYRRSPLVQGGLEIPCRLSARISVPSVKNNMLIERYKSILEELYEEPSEEIIMGSLLFDDPTEREVDMSLPDEAPEIQDQDSRKKRKISKTANHEKSNTIGSNDIRSFFKSSAGSSSQTAEKECTEDIVIVID